MVLAAYLRRRTTPMKDKKLGPLGYLACGLASLAAAVVTRGWQTALAFGLAVALALIFYPAALTTLRRLRFWLFTAILIGSSWLLIDSGTSPGPSGLTIGAQMAFRAATILVATGGILERVGVSQLAALLERLGMGGLGFAFGVALNSLPAIGEAARNSMAALRLRGGFRRQRIQAARQLMLTVLTNSLLYSEQVVVAAEARAYSPEKTLTHRLEWSRGDMILAGSLLLLVVALSLL